MPSVSEQEMTTYLLGGLSPERQTELAELIHNDAQLQEELLAIQQELYDQHLAGNFTADEQQYFQTHFLSSKSGQEQLHFARLFQNYRDNHTRAESFAVRVPAPTPPVTAPPPWFANLHRSPASVISMVVVAGLLATLIVWVSVKKSSTTHTTATTVPALTLSAGSTRSGGGIRVLPAPAKNDKVKVELELTKSDFKKYKTQLFRENEALESQEELPIYSKNTHYVVPVIFTGYLLTPGDYQLRLSGVPDSGQPEYIDSYTFRVTPETVPDPEQERNRMVR